MIIGLVGPKESGKTVLAKQIEKRLYYKRMSFANPFEEFVTHILQYQGCPFDIIQNLIHVNKEQPSRYLNGHTRRHVYKTIGECGRDILGEDFWINLLDNHIQHYFRDIDIIIDDVRRLNEAEYIRNKGGHLIYIHRECLDDFDLHISEQEMKHIKTDVTLENDNSIMDLYGKFEVTLDMWR